MGVSFLRIVLTSIVDSFRYTNRRFRNYIPEECKRLRSLGLDQVIEHWGLEGIGESLSKRIRESFRPSSNGNKRKRLNDGRTKCQSGISPVS